MRIIITVLLLTLCLPAFSDTYQIFTLDNDNGSRFYGMDDSGNAVLYRFDWGCGGGCNLYLLFSNGASVGQTTVTPGFSNDSGFGCTPNLDGAVVVKGVCNNGRQAFLGNFVGDPTPFRPALYVGTDLISLIGNGEYIFMNAKGDVIWNDAVRENWYEAINMTHNPEPSSWLLLATGLAAILKMKRRDV